MLVCLYFPYFKKHRKGIKVTPCGLMFYKMLVSSWLQYLRQVVPGHIKECAV